MASSLNVEIRPVVGAFHFWARKLRPAVGRPSPSPIVAFYRADPLAQLQARNFISLEMREAITGFSRPGNSSVGRRAKQACNFPKKVLNGTKPRPLEAGRLVPCAQEVDTVPGTAAHAAEAVHALAPVLQALPAVEGAGRRARQQAEGAQHFIQGGVSALDILLAALLVEELQRSHARQPARHTFDTAFKPTLSAGAG